MQNSSENRVLGWHQVLGPGLLFAGAAVECLTLFNRLVPAVSMASPLLGSYSLPISPNIQRSDSATSTPLRLAAI